MFEYACPEGFLGPFCDQLIDKASTAVPTEALSCGHKFI